MIVLIGKRYIRGITGITIHTTANIDKALVVNDPKWIDKQHSRLLRKIEDTVMAPLIGDGSTEGHLSPYGVTVVANNLRTLQKAALVVRHPLHSRG
jgi:hypothetical protein